MPKLNTNLVMSIIDDLKELVNVSNEIYTRIGDIEHQSWKFPTKNGRNINVLEIVEHHKGTAGEMYILLLELAYDRCFTSYFMTRFPVFLNFFFPFLSAQLKSPYQVFLYTMIFNHYFSSIYRFFFFLFLFFFLNTSLKYKFYY